MVRFVFYVSGRLALFGAVAFLALFVDHATARNTVAGSMTTLPDNLAYAGMMAAAWLVCSAGVMLMDRLGRIAAGPIDPYEDHPKMSPSVQPYYIDYGRLSAMKPRRDQPAPSRVGL